MLDGFCRTSCSSPSCLQQYLKPFPQLATQEEIRNGYLVFANRQAQLSCPWMFSYGFSYASGCFAHHNNFAYIHLMQPNQL